MDRRRLLQLCLATPAVLALGRPQASAQRGFPERLLRIVVPFPPGGPDDLIARTYAQTAGDLLGQPIVVENKAGGEASIAAVDVARAAPDGSSFLLGGSPTHVLTPARMPNPPYNAERDFAQIAVVGTQPLCIAVANDSPAKTLQELIAIAKAAPGKLNYAQSSSSVRLGAEMFKIRAGNLDITAVPYRGVAPALQDVLGGRIEVLPAVAGSVSTYHREGVIRVLAVFSDKRVASMPGVPTAEEAGVPDLKVSSFNILCTTAGTPASVIATLYDATRQVLASDAFVKFLQSNGLDPVPGSNPESATRFVREQIAVLTPLIIATKEKS